MFITVSLYHIVSWFFWFSQPSIPVYLGRYLQFQCDILPSNISFKISVLPVPKQI